MRAIEDIINDNLIGKARERSTEVWNALCGVVAEPGSIKAFDTAAALVENVREQAFGHLDKPITPAQTGPTTHIPSVQYDEAGRPLNLPTVEVDGIPVAGMTPVDEDADKAIEREIDAETAELKRQVPLEVADNYNG